MSHTSALQSQPLVLLAHLLQPCAKRFRKLNSWHATVQQHTFGDVWAGSMAAENPTGDVGDSNSDCLGAGRTRTKLEE